MEDFDPSLAYYRVVLGFELAWRDRGFGNVQRDGDSLMLCLGSRGAPGTWVYLDVDDADTLHQEPVDRLGDWLDEDGVSWRSEPDGSWRKVE